MRSRACAGRMRALLVLVLAFVLASGCVSNNEGAPPAANATTNGTMSANMTMEAKEIGSDSHDFTAPSAPGGSPVAPAAKQLTVPEGYSNLTINVTFAPANGAPGAVAAPPQGVTVRVGNATCAVPAGPLTSSVSCTKSAPVKPGPVTISYRGEGPIMATVKVSVR